MCCSLLLWKMKEVRRRWEGKWLVAGHKINVTMKEKLETLNFASKFGRRSSFNPVAKLLFQQLPSAQWNEEINFSTRAFMAISALLRGRAEAQLLQFSAGLSPHSRACCSRGCEPCFEPCFEPCREPCRAAAEAEAGPAPERRCEGRAQERPHGGAHSARSGTCRGCCRPEAAGLCPCCAVPPRPLRRAGTVSVRPPSALVTRRRCARIVLPSVPPAAYKGGGRGEAGRARRGPAGPMQPAMMMFSSKYWARRGFSLDSALPEERPAAGSLTVSAGAGPGSGSAGASPPCVPPCSAPRRPVCGFQQLQGWRN